MGLTKLSIAHLRGCLEFKVAQVQHSLLPLFIISHGCETTCVVPSTTDRPTSSKAVGAVGRVDQSKCRGANAIRKLLLEKSSEEADLDDDTIAKQFALIKLDNDKANT